MKKDGVRNPYYHMKWRFIFRNISKFSEANPFDFLCHIPFYVYEDHEVLHSVAVRYKTQPRSNIQSLIDFKSQKMRLEWIHDLERKKKKTHFNSFIFSFLFQLLRFFFSSESPQLFKKWFILEPNSQRSNHLLQVLH